MATTNGFSFEGWDDEEQLLSDEMVYTSLASGGSGASVANDEEEPEGADMAKGGTIFEVPLEVRRERVAQWRMAALASWQLAFSAIMAFVMPILLPLQTIAIVGKADKGTALGFGLSVATVVATIVSLVSGQASDHISTRLGKRTPFVILGSIGMALSLFAMSWYGDLGLTGAGVYVVYAVLLVIMRTFASVSETAFQPLLPDLIPKEQMGTVSGWWAMSSMLGNVFGAAGMSFIMDKTGPVVITLGLSSALVLGTVVATLTNREKPKNTVYTPKAPDNDQECVRVPALRFLARYSKPFLISSNFRWIFATRFLTQLGWGFVNSFAFFFVTDVAPKPYRLFNLEFTNSNDAVGVFLGSVLLSAVFSGYVGGALGDRLGRKRMVYVSSAFQSLACLGFALFSIWPQQFIYIVLCSVLMGIGLGAYLAVDFALATECLPSEESRGTDLAVWSLTSTLPSAIAGPLGGLMLDNGQRVGQALSLPNLGYVGLFGSCAVLLAVSGFLVCCITVGNPNPTNRKKHGGINFELVELEELEDEQAVATPAVAGEDRESLMHISEGEIN